MRSLCKAMVFAAALSEPAWAAGPGAQATAVYANGRSPGPNPMDAVTANVRARLIDDRVLAGATITLATSPTGVVTLVGDMPSALAKSEAVEVARTTPGVTEVDDELRLDVSSPNAPAPP